MPSSRRRTTVRAGLLLVAVATVAACQPVAGGAPGSSSSAGATATTTRVGFPSSLPFPTGSGIPSSSSLPTSTTLVPSSTTTGPTTTTTAPPTTTDPNRVPTLTVSTVMTGLDHPWDVAVLPDGTLLTGNRSGSFFALKPGAAAKTAVSYDRSTLFASGETGVMGVEPSTGFAANRTVYVCQGRLGSPNSIEVAKYTVDAGTTALTRSGTVVSGIQTTTGRHGGCRIRDLGDGSLLIGTGDAAVGTNPQDRTSLNGKTLRVAAGLTNVGWPGNPFLASSNEKSRLIQSYGHRNVQGLAVRANGSIYSVEQGTFQDDEVNLLAAGADYGYNPVAAGDPNAYNEAVPMTRAGAVAAVWRSGLPTIATAGASFTKGAAWGKYTDWLAVGVQKNQRLMLLQLPQNGSGFTQRVDVLVNQYGRIRSVTTAPDGTLLLTTDNGGNDQVLRVTPS